MMPKSLSPQRLFGEVVRAERLKIGLSQDELAHRSGLNRVYMGEVERGEKSVSIETIAKIASALKVKGGELLIRAGI
jgi:transcriptional regulator with XRE-family HTH domain